MCGIAGALDQRSTRTPEELRAIAAAMAGELRHRGPDGRGVWCDAARGVAFGHTRLAVVDLSPAGAQPMVSRDGRWVLAFNGEIYNHAALRAKLPDPGTLQGTSDTEVLLEAAAAWGPERALRQANGMFALALWDRWEERLLLARDRMGEKPLYYAETPQGVLFASELKSLRRHPDFRARMDAGGLEAYIRYGYVPAPHTILADVRKLPPGCLLWLRRGQPAGAPQPYWDLAAVALAGQAEPWDGTPDEAAEAVAALASDAVRLRMRADVPVGAFLSGGLDSSLVVALMRAHTSRPVRTFSIGFEEAAYDEAPHARAVAEHLGTDHTELTATTAEALEVIKRLPDIYDEPFADSSQIPTCLLAALTRDHVTVSLSGDGGDELFAGYARYRFHDRLDRGLRILPAFARHRMARAVTRRDAAWWERHLTPLRPLVRTWAPPGRLGERVHRAGELLSSESSLYLRMMSVWPDPATVLRHTSPDPHHMPAPPGRLPIRGSARLRYADQRQYLPDDILVKVDRATMAVGLEARVPLLDHRLVELAWRLPESLLTPGGGKQVLRQVAAGHVPPDLTGRPKTGFGVPVGAWLRGPLRPWADELLADARTSVQHVLEPAAVETLWREHLDQRGEHGPRLWTLLMLQSWMNRWGAA